MERREVLRRTIAGGMTMVITHLLPETLVDAAELAKKKPKVQFQEGTLTGGGVDGWKALIAVTGSTVRGTCWDPASVGGGHYDGWRVRGRKRNDTVTMDFFALADHGFSKPIGKCRGKARGKRLRAPFSLFNVTGVQGGAGGQMDVAEVKTSPATQREFAGEYVGEFFIDTEGVEATEAAGSFRMSVDASGKFRISDGTSNSPRLQSLVPKDTAGRWGMTSEGTIYTATQTDELVMAESPIDYSEVNKGNVVEDTQGVQGENLLGCFFLLCSMAVNAASR